MPRLDYNSKEELCYSLLCVYAWYMITYEYEYELLQSLKGGEDITLDMRTTVKRHLVW